MLRSLLVSSILLVTGICASAQQFWSPVDVAQIQLRTQSSREITPEHFKSFKLDKTGIYAIMLHAPEESKYVL